MITFPEIILPTLHKGWCKLVRWPKKLNWDSQKNDKKWIAAYGGGGGGEGGSMKKIASFVGDYKWFME